MMDQKMVLRALKLLRQRYANSAVACERRVMANAPDDKGGADDEQFVAQIGAQAQRWLWCEVESDIKKLILKLESK